MVQMDYTHQITCPRQTKPTKSIRRICLIELLYKYYASIIIEPNQVENIILKIEIGIRRDWRSNRTRIDTDNEPNKFDFNDLNY